MSKQKNIYTTAELEALGAVNQNQSLGISENPMWKLGATSLLFELIWPDQLKINSLYGAAFREAKLKATKDLTANLQQPGKVVAKPAEKIVLGDLSLEKVA